MRADLPRLVVLEALDAGKPICITESVDIPAAISQVPAISEQMAIGHRSNPASQLGPLIRANQHNRVQGFVDRALTAGLEAMPRRAAVAEQGFYTAPTILRDVPPNAEIAHDEVFGPVLAKAIVKTSKIKLRYYRYGKAYMLHFVRNSG